MNLNFDLLYPVVHYADNDILTRLERCVDVVGTPPRDANERDQVQYSAALIVAAAMDDGVVAQAPDYEWGVVWYAPAIQTPDDGRWVRLDFGDIQPPADDTECFESPQLWKWTVGHFSTRTEETGPELYFVPEASIPHIANVAELAAQLLSFAV